MYDANSRAPSLPSISSGKSDANRRLRAHSTLSFSLSLSPLLFLFLFFKHFFFVVFLPVDVMKRGRSTRFSLLLRFYSLSFSAYQVYIHLPGRASSFPLCRFFHRISASFLFCSFQSLASSFLSPAFFLSSFFLSFSRCLLCFWSSCCPSSSSSFSNGKIMGTGASSVEELRRTMKKIAKRLKTHPLTKYPVRLTRFRVSNILGSYCYPSPLSLHLLSSQRNLHVDYEPERFPGARVKIVIPKKERCRSSLDEDEDEEEEEDAQDLSPAGVRITTASRHFMSIYWLLSFFLHRSLVSMCARALQPVYLPDLLSDSLSKSVWNIYGFHCLSLCLSSDLSLYLSLSLHLPLK